MGHLLIEKKDGVARLMLDKPPVNVIDIALMRELQAALGEIERLYLTELIMTEDANEGLAAFVEKRKAIWKNR